MKSRLFFAPLLAVGLVAGASAQVVEDLRSRFAMESRLLDEELRLYGEARSRERAAFDRYGELNRRLDRRLEDPNVAVDDLVRLEAEIAASRETALLRARESGEARQRMYDRMRTLAGIVAQFERTSDLDALFADGGIGGLWMIEAGEVGVTGLLKLRSDGSTVTGSYRMSTGGQGSVEGTLSGSDLRLDLVDSRRGLVGSVEGTFEGTRIEGSWRATELAAGRPAAGAWTARKISGDEALGLDF